MNKHSFTVSFSSTLNYGRKIFFFFLFLSSNVGWSQPSSTITSDNEIIVTSSLPIRDYTPDIYKIKIWDPDNGLFITKCTNSEKEIFDCNQYLQSVGKIVISDHDLEKINNSSNQSFDILLISEISDTAYDSLSFTARFGSSEEKRKQSETAVRDWMNLIINQFGDRIPTINTHSTLLPELPGVIVENVPKGIIIELSNSPLVKMIRILESDGKIVPLSSDPLPYYPSTWPDYLYGDIYRWNPYMRGLFSGKIAIVEPALPNQYYDINPPWYSSDIYSTGASPWDSDIDHATNVASVVTWQNANQGNGLLYYTRPYWVAFNVNPDNPSTYSSQLSFLQQNQVDVANFSMVFQSSYDPSAPPKMVELALDWETWSSGRPLVSIGAGNDPNREIVQRTWNSIIVGSRDSSCDGVSFSWKNPSTYYSDRELPDVVARACFYLPTYSYSGEGYAERAGTSFSTPVFTSLIGLLVEKFKLMGYSAPHAEILRSIVYASGNGSCDPYWKKIGLVYQYGYWSDCQYGLGDLRQDNAISIIASGGWDSSVVISPTYQAYYGPVFQVPSGKSYRAAIAWSQPVSCDQNGGNCDLVNGYLYHDFDLYIQESTSPNGPWTTPSPFTACCRLSFRNESSWELVHSSNLDPQKYYRLYAPVNWNGSFRPTTLGVAWRIY